MDPLARPLLVFDGDCRVCTSWARWAARPWEGSAQAVPWQFLGQSGLRALGLSLPEAQAAAWWVDGSNRRFRGHRAVGRALLAGGGGRRVAGALVLTPPLSWAAAVLYRLVARYRHRLPGATPACRVGDG